MHTSSSSVMFTPFNFHSWDPSRLTSQGAELEINSEETKPKYFRKTYNEGVKLKEVSDIPASKTLEINHVTLELTSLRQILSPTWRSTGVLLYMQEIEVGL
jgi:hypothetical protein